MSTRGPRWCAPALLLCYTVVAACDDAPKNHAYELRTDCSACHQDLLKAAKSPDHGALGLSEGCDSCHRTSTWEGATFPIHDDWFALDGGHAALECKDCHAGETYAGTPAVCAGCHQADFDGTGDPDHPESGFPSACSVCHTTAAWDPSTWTGHPEWPLTGAHVTAACTGCHEGGVFEGTPEECAGCHMPDYQATTDPDHEQESLPTTCNGCHSTTAWEPAALDHDQFWPLTGAHTTAGCASCHASGYEGTPKECQGCHMPDYQATKDPDHVESQLPTACEACHTTAAWRPAALDHDQLWPLEGKHEAAACGSCHEGGVYEGTPKDCAGCHLPDYQGAKDPDHAAQGLPTTCETCHTPAAWEPASFDHDAYWPLTGAHTTAECASCHQGGVFAGTQTTCWGCHAPDYQGTKDPDHEADHLPTTCDACHSTAAWEPASFDGHDAYWPLEGAHDVTPCESCHVEGLYDGTPTACKACHLDDFQGTTAPNHVAEGYPQSCEACHGPAAWKPATYDGHHDLFPLEGKHATAQCTACHGDGTFLGTPDACVGCHQADYAATTDPDHEAEQLPTSCGACHGVSGWSPATFDGHDGYWPLTGAHATAECATCHAGGYDGTPKECVGCHLGKYNATTNPDHEVEGFPKTCEACHGTAAWKPATYTGHDQLWPLTGKHKAAPCGQCHVGGVYDGTPTACWGCHAGELTGTDDPDHEAAAFPHTCETCHGTSAWEPSTFNHAQYWPLTGAHMSADCASCHAGGTYDGTPTACQSCHLPDWQGADSPDHAALAIGKTCETCHATSSWATNKFPEHDKVFLISKGDHKGKQCVDCHKVAGSWSSFTCVSCHKLTEMNAEHLGEVANYQSTLDAAATVDHGCLKCHPNGEKDDD